MPLIIDHTTPFDILANAGASAATGYLTGQHDARLRQERLDDALGLATFKNQLDQTSIAARGEQQGRLATLREQLKAQREQQGIAERAKEVEVIGPELKKRLDPSEHASADLFLNNYVTKGKIDPHFAATISGMTAAQKANIALKTKAAADKDAQAKLKGNAARSMMEQAMLDQGKDPNDPKYAAALDLVALDPRQANAPMTRKSLGTTTIGEDLSRENQMKIDAREARRHANAKPWLSPTEGRTLDVAKEDWVAKNAAAIKARHDIAAPANVKAQADADAQAAKLRYESMLSQAENLAVKRVGRGGAQAPTPASGIGQPAPAGVPAPAAAPVPNATGAVDSLTVQVEQALTQRLGRSPTDDELALAIAHILDQQAAISRGP